MWFWNYLNKVNLDHREEALKRMSFEDRLELRHYLGKDPDLKILFTNSLFEDTIPSPELAGYLPMLKEIQGVFTYSDRLYKSIEIERSEWMAESLYEIGVIDRSIAIITGKPVGEILGLIPTKDPKKTLSVVIDELWYGVVNPSDILNFEIHTQSGRDLRIQKVNERKWIITEEDGDVDISILLEASRVELYSSQITFPSEEKEKKVEIDPSLAEFMLLTHPTYPIRVGNLTIHGDLLTMKHRSRFIGRLFDAMESPFEPFPHLLKGEYIGKEQEKEGKWKKEENIASFLYVWDYLQGFTPPHEVSPGSWYYINYFEIPLDTPFVDQYISFLLQSIATKKHYLQVVSIVRSIPAAIKSSYSIMSIDEKGVVGADDMLIHAREFSDGHATTLDPAYHDYSPVLHQDVRRGDISIVWDKEGTILINKYVMGKDGAFINREDVSRGELRYFSPPGIGPGEWLLYFEYKGIVSSNIGFLRSNKPRKFEYSSGGGGHEHQKDLLSKKVMSVEFNAGGKSTKHLIAFDHPTSVVEAMDAMREWMSVFVDEEYYNTMNIPAPWSVMSRIYVIRGDFTSGILLSRLIRKETLVLTL